MAISATHEVMIDRIARLIEHDHHVAVGAASPVPAAGALLARIRSDRRLRVSLLGSPSDNPFTDGGRELFDCAAQGRIDVFFLSGAQIDGSANVNLLGTGPMAKFERRFSGNFGAPFMVDMVAKIILFKEPHSTQTLVDKVDFISAAGRAEPGVWRRGGPKHLITDRCLFDFDQDGFELRTLHPGQTLADIKAHTGFEFKASADVQPEPDIDDATRTLIQGEVLDGLRETYPAYVQAALA